VALALPEIPAAGYRTFTLGAPEQTASTDLRTSSDGMENDHLSVAVNADGTIRLTDRATGALLGAVGVGVKPWDAGMAEIGYWLAPEARGRGAATRALVLLSRWTLREWPIGRLHLMADVDNTASQAVAERAGFTREGVMRSGMLARGVARDHVVFSLLPGEA
jgi:RimJ/RimL family protein N-acetyltransferase